MSIISEQQSDLIQLYIIELEKCEKSIGYYHSNFDKIPGSTSAIYHHPVNIEMNRMGYVCEGKWAQAMIDTKRKSLGI